MHVSPLANQPGKRPFSLNCSKAHPSIILATPGSDGYTAMAEYIRAVYRKTYQADIDVTYPWLMGLMQDGTRLLSALGIRYASEHGRLFLEQYLPSSAEEHIREATGELPLRQGIAEAGNLASAGKGDVMMLLYGLACHLEQEGMSFILFTGTALLRRYLNSLGLFPYVLAPADPARLGPDAARWGTYYDTKPYVMAGSVLTFRKGLEDYFTQCGRIRQ
ncbi:hypothetical protein GC177_09230 [bacterium]|nr:hypothetical protein [bacterium]